MSSYQSIRKEVQAVQFKGHDHPFTPPPAVKPLPLYWRGLDGEGLGVGGYQRRLFFYAGKHDHDIQRLRPGDWIVQTEDAQGQTVIKSYTDEDFHKEYEPAE